MINVLIDGRPIREPLAGVAVFVKELVKALIENENEPTIFLQSDKEKNRHLDGLTYNKKIISNGSRFLENICYEFFYDSKLLSNFKNYIVHETYFSRMPVSFEKKITTIHDVIPLDHPDWFSFSNRFFSRRNFFRQASESNLLAFPSNYSLERAHNFFDIKAKSIVIPLAVSNAIHNAKLSYNKKIISNNENPYVLMVGNIEPRKNIALTAEAIGVINKRLNLDLDLVLIGKNVFGAEDIIQSARIALGKDPICLGFVSESKKIEMYQKCACHVYASKYEGFGFPPIESLIIGAPTVIAANTSLIDNIPNHFFSFESDNLESLIEAISRNLFKDPADILSTNFDSFANKYHWNNVAKNYLDVYKSLSD